MATPGSFHMDRPDVIVVGIGNEYDDAPTGLMERVICCQPPSGLLFTKSQPNLLPSWLTDSRLDRLEWYDDKSNEAFSLRKPTIPR